MGIRKPIHERVLNASNKEELKAAYSDWAAGYDRDLIDEMGYVAPKIASDLLLKYLNDTEAHILDALAALGARGNVVADEIKFVGLAPNAGERHAVSPGWVSIQVLLDRTHVDNHRSGQAISNGCRLSASRLSSGSMQRRSAAHD